MYMYIHICKYTCVYLYMHIHIYIYIYVSLYMYTCIHACIHGHMQYRLEEELYSQGRQLTSVCDLLRQQKDDPAFIGVLI